jgi:hypothetical protein
LAKDNDGVWGGHAEKGVASTGVWLDYKGNVGTNRGGMNMVVRTITHLYDNYDEATRVVADLETAGIPHADISVVGQKGETENHAGSGAGIGAVIGGGAGLLAGIGSLAIPGVGPVVAAGWLVATIAGVAVGGGAGGIVGSLVRTGISNDEANVYPEGVRRGGSLVTVRTDETHALEVERVMDGHNHVDWQSRGKEYRDTGWTAFDEAAPP